MHLLSKVFHGQGSFEDTLALVGIGTAAATLATLIPVLLADSQVKRSLNETSLF
jgi:hypothetical protein